MFDVEALVKALGIVGFATFVLIVLAYKFGDAKISIWRKREDKEIESFDVTIDALQETKLTLRQRLSHTEAERDSYKEIGDGLRRAKDEALQQRDELQAKLELRNADVRRLEGDLQQASIWSAQLAAWYEGRIARLKAWIRRHH